LAHGQPAPSSPTQQDEQHRTELYKQGVDAAAAGRWAEAKERFAAALAIRSSAKVVFSLAEAEEQLGQLGAASRHYDRALDSARAAGETDVVSAAANAIAALEPRVPKLRVVVSGASWVASPMVTIDGEPAPAGALVAVDAGRHRVMVTAPGMRDALKTVDIGERERLDVPVSLEEAAAAGAPTSSPGGDQANASEGTEFPWRVVGLAAGGAGIAALGVGSYFGLLAKSKNDQSNSSGCTPNNDCSGSAAAIRRDAISAANTSTVFFVVGGVLLAGGVALWFLAPSQSNHVGVGVAPVARGGQIAVKASW
jgi:hypothetical protein